MRATSVHVSVHTHDETKFQAVNLDASVTVDVGDPYGSGVDLFFTDLCELDRLIEAAQEARVMLARKVDRHNLSLLG